MYKQNTYTDLKKRKKKNKKRNKSGMCCYTDISHQRNLKIRNPATSEISFWKLYSTKSIMS